MLGKKRILIYAHYYVPDVASTGQILKELAEGIKDEFDITIICVVPSYTGVIEDKYKKKKYYKENINGINVIRVKVPEFSKANKISRVKNILAYFFRAIIATFKVGKQDYVFSISHPPVLGGLLGVIGKFIKRAKFIYNIQDFNPEQIMAVSYSKNKLILNLMMFFDKFCCKMSSKVIVVGRDMAETLKKRFKNKKIPNYAVINNWIDESEIYPLDSNNENVLKFKNKYGLDNKYVIMYSGNIGLYYDLENIIKVIEKFPKGTKTNSGKEVVFAFVGAGTVLDNLVEYKKKHNMDNVVFIPYQDKSDLIYSLNAGDVHWCVNAKGIKGVSCPSKYYGIASCQKPVLGVLEEGSEIRCIIDETESGLCSEPEDYDSIENNIKWFIENADSKAIEDMAKNGYNNLMKNLTRKVSVNKYKEEILNS